MAEKITEELEDNGVTALTQTTIKSSKRLESGKIEVELVVKGNERKLVVDTVLVAIGRDPDPTSFGAGNAGITVDEGSGKIKGR